MSNSGTTFTFWRLIDTCQVVIPRLQRDYAQGRENDPAIEQIRSSLIKEINGAVTEGKPLVLNFVYGEKDEEKNRFIPVDGQQRLTTLFLLHWYVFLRSGFNKGLERLTRFSYETRDTSQRFCEKICGESIDFSLDTISDQLRECPWFTGLFSMDPTIKSMLVVMDALHEEFRKLDDIESIKNTLIDDNCPITFLWLELPNFQQTSDLYIKMNARGKLLSDFEIFKAKLQNSEILDQILGKDHDERDKILFISRYNNEFAEFFYKFFQADYDNALMGFVKEIIRDTYLSYVSKSGVSPKTFRPDYGRIKNMSGSVLFQYIESGGTGYEQCKNPDKIFITALTKVETLLEHFSSMKDPMVFENTISKDYYDEKDLFTKSYSKSLEEDVASYALYTFLYKFGIPSTSEQKSAYSMWRRIVYNVVTNSSFESHIEDICSAFVILEGIVEKTASCEEISVLNSLSTISADKCPAAIRYQMEEEVIKAGLIIDANWKKQILEAELYFRDGEIGFILNCSKMQNGTYDIGVFHRYFECLCKVFDGEKRLKNGVNSSTFEQALLCMKDGTVNHTGHLLKQPNSTTSWGFVRSNYKALLKNTTSSDKKRILQALLDSIDSSNADINTTLGNIISNTDKTKFVDEAKWKIPFIDNDLFDAGMEDFTFKNCINLDQNNSVVLMMAGTTVRSKSTELNTFLLYQELCNKKIASKLVLYATGAMKDNEGFPTRYIEVDNARIGYDNTDKQKPYVLRRSGNIERFSWTDIISKVTAVQNAYSSQNVNQAQTSTP